MSNLNGNEVDFMFKLIYPELTSSLSLAAQKGDLKLLKSLLAKGHLPQAPDNRGWCAIHASIAYKQTEALKLILNYKKRNKTYLCNLCTWEGESPLIIAAKSDSVSIEIFKVLLESKADVKIATNEGMTALHFLCRKRGNSTVVKLLIDYGADVNAQELVNGSTPLHMAIVEASDVELVKCLLPKSNLSLIDFHSETALYKASISNFKDAVRLILSKDITTVNTVSEMKFSPLSAAAFKGDLEIVNMLLDVGASTEFIGRACVRGEVHLQEKFLPIHSSLVNLEVFKALLHATNPSTLLQYDSTLDCTSLSVYIMMYSSGAEYFEALLQHQFPLAFDSLKIVSFSKLADFISHADYCREILLEKFQLFFKYCSYFEPENVFEHFTSVMADDELLGIPHLLNMLAKMGVSSADAYESKHKVIRLLQDSLDKGGSKERSTLETIIVLSRPVLTLKQLSRVAFRRLIRSISSSEWSAYTTIRDSNLPPHLKLFIWYQIF